nr:MAG TPA: hypothetical protein [Caudoviricetes sp.]
MRCRKSPPTSGLLSFYKPCSHLTLQLTITH